MVSFLCYALKKNIDFPTQEAMETSDAP